MRNDPLSREGAPREHQGEMGDGPTEQVDGIRPLFPKERGGKRVEDRKVLSGIIACHSEGAALGGCPGPTKPSTTVFAAGQTRVSLI